MTTDQDPYVRGSMRTPEDDSKFLVCYGLDQSLRGAISTDEVTALEKIQKRLQAADLGMKSIEMETIPTFQGQFLTFVFGQNDPVGDWDKIMKLVESA